MGSEKRSTISMFVKAILSISEFESQEICFLFQLNFKRGRRPRLPIRCAEGIGFRRSLMFREFMMNASAASINPLQKLIVSDFAFENRVRRK